MLYGSLTKYQHVERLGHEDVEGLLGGPVYVQEKLDGANASVALVDGKIVIASRNNAVSIGGQPEQGFNGLIEYVLNHPGILAIINNGWVLRGEWLVRHSLDYAKDSYRHFYVFDVQENGRYLAPEEYEPQLSAHGIRFIASTRMDEPTVEKLVAFLDTMPSAYGASKPEGIVVKAHNFVNRYGRTTWGKLVSEDFKVANKINFGAGKSDPAEIRLASLITPERVMKLLAKIEEDKGAKPNVTHMFEVLGRMWHEIITEELWDFVKKNPRVTIDFSSLRKLVEKQTRDLALNIFNGLPSIKMGE